MAASDPIDEFISLPRDKQVATLGKLPQEKQDRLLGLVTVKRAQAKLAPTIQAMKPQTETKFEKDRKVSTGVTAGADAIDRFVNSPLFPSMARLATRQSEAEQQALYRSMGPESAKRGEISKFLNYVQSVGHGTARVILGAAGMSPADISVIVGSAISGQPEVGGAYFAAKGAVNAPKVIKAAVANPSPENVEAAAGTGATIAGGLAGGMGGTRGAPSIEETGQITSAQNRALTPPQARIAKLGREMRAAVTGTSPHETAKLAKETQATNVTEATKAADKNALNTQSHLESTQESLQDIEGEKIERGVEKSAKEKGVAEKHAKDIADVKEHNKRVTDKHTEAANGIKAENERVGEVIEHRRNLEQQLEQKRTEYRQRRVAAAEKAKADEKAAWNDTRTKIEQGDGPKTGSGQKLLKAIKDAEKTKLKGTTPEAIRTFHSIVADVMEKLKTEEDAQTAAKVTAEGGTPATPAPAPAPHPLWVAVNKLLEQAGEGSEVGGTLPKGVEPDLLEGGADVEIPFDQIHGWVSELGSEIARQDRLIKTQGVPRDIKAAMTHVWNVAHEMMDNIARENGASDSLTKARAATMAEREAFSGESRETGSASNKAQASLDPEGVKAEKLESRVGKVSVFDPELSKIARDINGLETALTHVPKEDALTRQLKPLPAPPTIGDLRESHRLNPEPPPPEATVLAPPRSVPPPDRPPTIVPEVKLIGPEEVRAAKAAGLQERADMIRRRGTWIATGAAGYRLLSHVLSLQLEKVPFDILEGGMVLAGVSGVAKLLENPSFAKLVTSPTADDLAQIPPELRSQLWPVVQEAAKMGYKVDPRLAALAKTAAAGAAGGASNQANTPVPPPIPARGDEDVQSILNSVDEQLNKGGEVAQ